MFNQEIFISSPGFTPAHRKMNNDEIIELVRKNFAGDKRELKNILQGIKMIFRYCDSDTRYFGTAENKNPIDYCIDPALSLMKKHNIFPQDIDLVVYGGIFRDYFEPATAMEVAAKLGVQKVHAFDVTSACSGFLQSTYVAATLMQNDPSINTALICAVDFPEVAIDYNIQSFDELSTKAAGLTLGSGGAAWFLQKKPFAGGGSKLLLAKNVSLPQNYEICQTPVFGKFRSQNRELFELGRKHVPALIREMTGTLGWKVDDVDYFVSHQAGKKIISELVNDLGVSMKKAPVTHTLYGNTVNITIPMTMDHLVKQGSLKKGNKIIMTTVAAGFTMVALAVEWT